MVRSTRNLQGDDQHWMTVAINAATVHQGSQAPNPCVGCVIVNANGRLIAKAVTAPHGRPHAELLALERLLPSQRLQATVYVTLEPCAHHGQTPPCTQALIQAGIKRVVVAMIDPNSLVAGQGIQALRAAGIQVDVQTDALFPSIVQQAQRLHAGHRSVQLRHRPLLTAKVATSLDGAMAIGGISRWISGSDTRLYAQYLRARHDAIWIGHGAMRIDTPQLTVRFPLPETQSPVRYALVRHHTSLQHFQGLQKSAQIPTVLIHPDTEPPPLLDLPRRWRFQPLPTRADNRIDEHSILEMMTTQDGITSVMVEGGACLLTSLLRRRLVDRLIWVRAFFPLGRMSGPPDTAQTQDTLGDLDQLPPPSSDPNPLETLARWTLIDQRTFRHADLVVLENPKTAEEHTSAHNHRSVASPTASTESNSTATHPSGRYSIPPTLELDGW